MKIIEFSSKFYGFAGPYQFRSVQIRFGMLDKFVTEVHTFKYRSTLWTNAAAGSRVVCLLRNSVVPWVDAWMHLLLLWVAPAPAAHAILAPLQAGETVH